MKLLEKALFTAGGLLVGSALAFNVACTQSAPASTPNVEATVQARVKEILTSTPVPTQAIIQPTLTPISVIQLQRPTPTPSLATTTPLPTATSIPTSTSIPITTQAPLPTPRPPKPIAIYAETSYFTNGTRDADVSNITSYAWQNGLTVDVIRNDKTLREKIQRYSGIWVNPRQWFSPMPDSVVFLISEFVKNGGGRVFFEVSDEWCKSDEFNSSLRDYFGISFSCEDYLLKGVYKLNNSLIPVLGNFTAGFDSYRVNAFFVAPGDYITGNITSQTTKLSRAVTAYGRMGDGKVIFMVVDAGNRGESIFLDEYVNQYQNKDSSLQIMNWLAKSIDVP